MAVRIPYGIDPGERWEVDFCAAGARAEVEIQRDVVKRLDEAADAAAGERQAALRAEADKSRAALAQAEADLAAYQPESGPVFTVTAIPGARRAEIAGRHAEIEAMSVGKGQALARAEWAEDVIRLAVRGHRNLQTRSGRDIPYVAGELGAPSDATLLAYGAMLVDLAWVVLNAQRLGPAGKNA